MTDGTEQEEQQNTRIGQKLAQGREAGKESVLMQLKTAASPWRLQKEGE